VPAAPTGFASTVAAPSAGADAAGSDAAGADAGGAADAGAVDGEAPVELHPTTRAAVMNRDPTIRAFDRMAQDLAAEMVRRRLLRPTRGLTSGRGEVVSWIPGVDRAVLDDHH
jgi:hypothetical protein